MGLFFIVLCCTLAMLFATLAVAMGLKAGRTRSWTRVEGRVRSSGITIRLEQGEAEAGDFESWDRRYRPWVAYDYAVDGVPHRGTLVAPDLAEAYGSDTWALRTIAPYPVDSVVTVHHDPLMPAHAVLEPGASRITTLTICVLVVMSALCMTIAVLIANDPPPVPPPDFHTPN
jgi:hypothetical protein